MAKIYKPSKGSSISKYNTSDYTGPKLKPKSYPSPHKDVPVLRDRAPKGTKKVPIRYGKSRTITYAEQQRVKELSAVEEQTKRGGGDKKTGKRTGWGRFFRFGGGGGSPSAGQPKIGMRHDKARKEPKLQ